MAEYLMIDGVKLEYSIEGNGIPCVVISTATQHKPTFSEGLKKHLKLIFIDTKIFVPSESTDVELITMESITEDLEKTRIALGFERIALIGPSGYGLITLEYARKYSERTSHVIMIGSMPGFSLELRQKINEYWETSASEGRKLIQKERLAKFTEDYLSTLSPFEALTERYIANSPMYWYDPNSDATFLWEGVKYNMDAFNHYFYTLLAKYDITPCINEVKTPIFLALGRYDYSAPYVLWDGIRDRFSNLTYYLFEKSGHYPMFEQPDDFNEKIISWINKTVD